MGPRLTIKIIQWSSEKSPNDRKDRPSLNISKWHVTDDGQFTRCGKNVYAARSNTKPDMQSFDIDNGRIVTATAGPDTICRSCLRITGLKV